MPGPESTAGVADASTCRRQADVWFLLCALAAVNCACWIVAILVFRHSPGLLATALLAYTFGLRHAVDADHIAAIDNVTRKLMQEGRRPVFVGCFFALGHSTIVIALTIAIAASSGAIQRHFDSWESWGATAGTIISAGFLALIAIANIRILATTIATYRRRRLDPATPLDPAPPPTGLIARILRPLTACMSRQWQMYPLGLLFGLGFDTATEIGLLGIAESEAGHGMPLWSILVFPALFTAGMTLVDSIDGMLMYRAYGWAQTDPGRTLVYNMVVTSIAIAVAFLVGTIELAGLLSDRLQLHGVIWHWLGVANEHFSAIGLTIIGAFLTVWCSAAWMHRRRRLADSSAD